MSLAILFIALAIVAYFAYTFWRDYTQATGSVWDRVLASASNSATILWSKFVALIGVLVGGLSSAAEFLGDPSVGTAIQQYMKPEYVAGAMLLISVITILARKRTL